jgi:hypothetical protein
LRKLAVLAEVFTIDEDELRANLLGLGDEAAFFHALLTSL